MFGASSRPRVGEPERSPDSPRLRRHERFVASHESRGVDVKRSCLGIAGSLGAAGVVGVVAALLLMVVTLGQSPRADAAQISGAITGITIAQSEATQWKEVDVDCTWAVPDGSSPGDTFTLQLPAQLRWSGATDFPLKDADGNTVAQAHANSSGLVTFTLTDFVATHPLGVNGTCHFATQYIAATDGSQVDLKFQVGSTVLSVPVGTAPACQTNCSAPPRTKAVKWMWWSDASQQSTASLIAVPAATADSTDVVVSDTPGAGLELDCSSVVTHTGTTLDSQ